MSSSEQKLSVKIVVASSIFKALNISITYNIPYIIPLAVNNEVRASIKKIEA